MKSINTLKYSDISSQLLTSTAGSMGWLIKDLQKMMYVRDWTETQRVTIILKNTCWYEEELNDFIMQLQNHLICSMIIIIQNCYLKLKNHDWSSVVFICCCLCTVLTSVYELLKLQFTKAGFKVLESVNRQIVIREN